LQGFKGKDAVGLPAGVRQVIFFYGNGKNFCLPIVMISITFRPQAAIKKAKYCIFAA